jgi:microsomal epoxide hydrolase
MLKLIPLLTDPAAHGGEAADAFDVVIPSLPGFGFSDRPRQRGCDVAAIASLLHKLMTETLGYSRYAAHGGDWGSAITEQLAVTQPSHLIGIHLTEVPFTRLFSVPPADLTAAEQAYLKAGVKWQRNEGGYFAIQSTKPQTLAAGLADSPAGLAAWIVEKYRSWSDCGGELERRFTKDELLANITLYWVTQTIHSAMRLYYEARVSRPTPHPQRIEVKTAVSIFPKDLVQAPREYGERFFDIQRWTVQPRAGHFAAFEEPELVARDLREFFRSLR